MALARFKYPRVSLEFEAIEGEEGQPVQF